MIGSGRAANFPRCAAASCYSHRRSNRARGHARNPSSLSCRGLPGVHSRCGLHTRSVTLFRDRYPSLHPRSSAMVRRRPGVQDGYQNAWDQTLFSHLSGISGEFGVGRRKSPPAGESANRRFRGSGVKLRTKRNHGNNVDDLSIRIMLFQLGEVRVGGYRFVGDSARSRDVRRACLEADTTWSQGLLHPRRPTRASREPVQGCGSAAGVRDAGHDHGHGERRAQRDQALS